MPPNTFAPASQAAQLGSIRLKESAAPATPPAGYVQLYANASGLLNWKDAAGTVYSFAAPPAIGSTTPASGAFTTLSANNGVVFSGGNLNMERDGGTALFHILDNYGATPDVLLRRANGTKALSTAVQNNDQLGILSARGWGATGFSALDRARVLFRATENWTDAAQGTAIQFYTTTNGGTTLTDWMTLHGDGRLEINGVLDHDGAQSGFNGATPVTPPDWTAATGTASRATFDTASVTTAQLAQRVKAMIDDFLLNGLFA